MEDLERRTRGEVKRKKRESGKKELGEVKEEEEKWEKGVGRGGKREVEKSGRTEGWRGGRRGKCGKR